MDPDTSTIDVHITQINDDPPPSIDKPIELQIDPIPAKAATAGSPPRRRSLRKRNKAPLHSQDDAFTAATGVKSGKKGSRIRPAPLLLHVPSQTLSQGRKQSLPSPAKSGPVAIPPRKYSQPAVGASFAYPPPLSVATPTYSSFASSPTNTFFGPTTPVLPPPFDPSFAFGSFGTLGAKPLNAPPGLFQPRHYLQSSSGAPCPGYGANGSLTFVPLPNTVQLGSIDMLPLSDLPDRQVHINPLPLCKPHPYLYQPVIYLSNIPSDMTEAHISTFIAQSPPEKIDFQHHVPVNERLRPDQYYDWMPRHGVLHFSSLVAAEKALCIILARSSLKTAGLLASPFPPAPAFHPSPTVMPFPDHPVPARYIASHRHVERVIPRSADLLDVVAAQLPTPGELFDACRPWGAIRELEVWIQDNNLKDGEPIKWRARVEFWHEDAAHRFELGIGEQGCLIKGWEVHIFPDRPALYPYIPGALPHLPVPSLSTSAREHKMPLSSPLPGHPDVGQPHSLPFNPFLSTPLEALGVPPLAFSPPAPAIPLTQVPPWASHNPYAAAPMTPLTPPTPHGPGVSFVRQEPHIQRNGSISSHLSSTFGDGGTESGMPNAGLGLGGNSFVSMDGSTSSAGSAHSKRQRLQRTWSLTLENRPDGIVVPVGTKGSDGSFIAHGPGQHIRPAPPFGPGSNSCSGLVDYSNVYIKNLDPDINSWFLEELFSNVGRVVSAKVMRDEQGRSRGYGFISFGSPDEAMSAITRFNGQKLGAQYVVMTLHEPRKAPRERHAGNTRPKRSKSITSSLGSATAGHTVPVSPSNLGVEGNGTYDTLRSLDPEVRRAALALRIATRVEAYAHRYNIDLAYTAPTIAALAGHDLTLIPLLYNDDELEAKIAETFEVLLQDRDLAGSLGVDTGARDLARSPTPRDDVVLAAPIAMDDDAADSDQMDKLYKGIQAIDPVDTDQILPILVGQLEEGEITRALRSRSFLAFRYGLAKKELLRRQAELEGMGGLAHGTDLVNGTGVAAEPGLSLTHATSPTKATADDSAPGSATPPVSLAATAPISHELSDCLAETMELPSDMSDFAALPASTMIKRLAAPDSDVVVQKYGLARPSRETALQLAKWILGLRGKSEKQQGDEIAWQVGMRITIDGLKDSQRITLGQRLVQNEDREALCRLLAYPSIINLKASAIIGQLAQKPKL